MHEYIVDKLLNVTINFTTYYAVHQKYYLTTKPYELLIEINIIDNNISKIGSTQFYDEDKRVLIHACRKLHILHISNNYNNI